jgi:hypothetical protein
MYNMVMYYYVLIVFSLRQESLKLILATDPFRGGSVTSTLMVDDGTQTIDSGTLTVTSGTCTVDGGTLTVAGGTQTVGDGTRTSDD